MATKAQQHEANLLAVKSVQQILKMNNIKFTTVDSVITMNGKNYAVTTNTKDNELNARHYFTMRQVLDYKDNPNISGLIVYHTATDSCVIFTDISLFYAEAEEYLRFKKYSKKSTDSETGEEVITKTYVPYYLTDYKTMCQRFGWLSTPDNFQRVDRWVNSKTYYKKTYKKYKKAA